MIPKYITNSMEILLFMPSHNHRHTNTFFHTFGKPDEHYKSVVLLLVFYMKRIFTAERGPSVQGGGPSVRPDKDGGPSILGQKDWGSFCPRMEGPGVHSSRGSVYPLIPDSLHLHRIQPSSNQPSAPNPSTLTYTQLLVTPPNPVSATESTDPDWGRYKFVESRESL